MASFVPASLPSVVRILHPFRGHIGNAVRWDEAASALGLGSRAALAEELGAEHFGGAPRRIEQHYQEPRDGELEVPVAESLVAVLAQATTTPQDVFVAVWEGFGDIPPQRFPGAAHLPTPARGHFLLRGPIEGVLTSVGASRADRTAASGLWWPADRAWFVATEIDFPWTFVAGDPTLTASLRAREDLETLPSAFDEAANVLPDD